MVPHSDVHRSNGAAIRPVGRRHRSHRGSWYERIRAVELDRPQTLLNASERLDGVLTRSDLHDAVPVRVDIWGHPVPQVQRTSPEDLELALDLVTEGRATVIADDTILRATLSAPLTPLASLRHAQSNGLSVHAMTTLGQCWQYAEDHPAESVVLMTAGDESTLAPLAARMVRGLPANLSILVRGIRTWRVVAEAFVHDEAKTIDGVLIPGHVAAVMGPEEWCFLSERFQRPAVICGDEERDVLIALHALLSQLSCGEARLDNCLPRTVRAGGNPLARGLVNRVFEITDARWPEQGSVPCSAFRLRQEFRGYDARHRFTGH